MEQHINIKIVLGIINRKRQLVVIEKRLRSLRQKVKRAYESLPAVWLLREKPDVASCTKRYVACCMLYAARNITVLFNFRC